MTTTLDIEEKQFRENEWIEDFILEIHEASKKNAEIVYNLSLIELDNIPSNVAKEQLQAHAAYWLEKTRIKKQFEQLVESLQEEAENGLPKSQLMIQCEILSMYLDKCKMIYAVVI